MKVLFDTSVLIAAFVTHHPNHPACFSWLERAEQEQIQGVVSTHTLAEAYSVLTGTPNRSRISPSAARDLLTDLLQQFEAIPLVSEDYQTAVSRMVTLNLPGGGIFDALIAQAALKAKVDVVLTLNSKHFNRLGEEIARMVQVPA